MLSLRELIRSDAFGGLLLFAAAVLAILMNNSPLQPLYEALLQQKASITLGQLSLEKTLVHWINDGLMAIFFLLVGLEIKREVCKGILKEVSRLILPTAGAVGGFVLPALIYYYINQHDAIAIRGWAIPAATDIAFSLGILALLGKRVPISLKIFLSALAIIDDIVAIAVIAFFYTAQLSWLSLIFAIIMIVCLVLLNRFRVKNITPYILIGILLWVSVLKSGIHATLAGVVLAFAIPVEIDGETPLQRLEKALVPWVTYLVLPLFAFANSGFALFNLALSSITEPVALGITLGLFLGKQFGIFFTCWLLVKCRVAKLPPNVSWPQMYGIALLCGVGFTMSLFIGALAFAHLDPGFAQMVRLGVFTGSLLSGVCGYLLLSRCSPKKTFLRK